MMLKSISVALVIAITFTACQGFVISTHHSNGNVPIEGANKTSRPRMPSSFLQLHPDQAAELEACAYELMRQASSSSSSSAVRSGRGNVLISMVKQSKASSSLHHGNSVTFRPVAWCRRLMTTAFHQEYNHNQAKP